MPDPRPPVRYGVDVSDVSKLDSVLAHLCCWCAHYAYYADAAEYFRQILGASPIYNIPADPTTGRPQGFILGVDECDIVAFSGTTDYSQLYGLLRDMTYKTPDGGGPSLAAGYPYVRMAHDVLATYRTTFLNRMAIKKVIFTGHSLGGAIASLLCYALQNDGTTGLLPSNAVVFGTPRLGNRNLAVALAPQFNVVLPGDGVCKLPHKGYLRPVLTSDGTFQRSVWPTDSFCKHGKLTYLGDDGGLSVLDPGDAVSPDDVGPEYDAAAIFGQTFFSGVSFKNPAKLVAKAFSEALERHYCSEYLKRLEKNIPAVPDADGESLIKEAVFVEDKLAGPDPVLSTIAPPSYPTPAATQGVRPLTRRRRH